MASPPAIVVRDWIEVRAALEAARSQDRAVLLCSEQGASAWLGAGFWAALQTRAHAEFPDVRFDLVLDCADRAGDVMAGLRAGVRSMVFRGDPPALERLQDMARRAGANVAGG